ncbi:D-galactonate dehydratase [Luteitalea pratensis]|uniref:D-galactonate dehydratase n=1 Tax=Luteitalea pratensis TaxID=1855912 RepID=A0A143PMI7_LUTPR|nr:mandelate racemase/muconate lactonizing enzyme family protein [Luteitalea pratensis]AMY09423.1 D-galactonate dehydratase [Luteitalea pratensis]
MNGTSIARVEAFAIRLPRDSSRASGTAGSPVTLDPSSRTRYRRAATYPTVYSDDLETMLVRVETSDGVVGWGEAQAPVGPEIPRTIIEVLLGPLAIGEDALAPERLWSRLYSAMRVRGHTGGFLLDAIAAIDIAVWDICGKTSGQPVARLLGGPCHDPVPCYVSGLHGDSVEARVEEAQHLRAGGAGAFKLFLSHGERECLDTVRALREALGSDVGLAVDALWRLDETRALRFAHALAAFDVLWLEAPLAPEDVRGHARLARRSPVRLALGESYRTRFEVLPYFERGAIGVLQPDLGRSGITEARKLAVLADTHQVPVAPHVSIGLGPQIAAAIHFAAATPNLLLLECNPGVFELSARLAHDALEWSVAGVPVGREPGLGVRIDEDAVRRVAVGTAVATASR